MAKADGIYTNLEWVSEEWISEDRIYRELVDLFGSSEVALAELNDAFQSCEIRSVREPIFTEGTGRKQREENQPEFCRAHEFKRLNGILILGRICDELHLEVTDWAIRLSTEDTYKRWPSLSPDANPPASERRALPVSREPELRSYIKALGDLCGANAAREKAEGHFNAKIPRAKIRDLRNEFRIKAPPRPRQSRRTARVLK